MRWGAALAAALLFATPSYAKTVVIVPMTPDNNSDVTLSQQMRQLRGILDTWGVDYDVRRANTLSTIEASTGVVVDGNVTTTYSSAIVINFEVTNNRYPPIGAAITTGVYPNWLTRETRYHSRIPTLFIGTPRLGGSSIWASTDSCSTMVSGTFPSPYGTLIGNAFYRSQYSPGRTGYWKSKDGLVPMPLVTPGASSRVKVRALIKSGIASGLGQCTDCDGLTQASTDSVLLWRVDRALDTNQPLTTIPLAPLFFAWPTAAGTVSSSYGILLSGIAALDSAVRARPVTITASTPYTGRTVYDTTFSGNRVIGEKRGWSAPKLALLVSNAGRHTNVAAAETDAGGGITLDDSTSFKASLDSLGSLGVPITVHYAVDLDTLIAYPNELEWWRTKVPMAKFAPYVIRGGVGTLIGTTANTSKFRLVDPIGRNRTRPMGDSVGVSYCLDSPTTIRDTSLYCGLFRLFAIGDSVFGNRASRTLRAPVWDIIPNQYTYGRLPAVDSLNWVLYKAGVRVVIVNPSLPESSPGSVMNIGSSSGSQSPQLSNPASFGGSQSKLYKVYQPGTSTNIGYIRYAATRAEGAIEPKSSRIDVTSHVWSDEAIWGNFSKNGAWYPSDYQFYRHNFRTTLDVFEMPATLFQGTSGANYRFAWWQFKWVANQVKMVNTFAGRDVWLLTYTDDL